MRQLLQDGLDQRIRELRNACNPELDKMAKQESLRKMLPGDIRALGGIVALRQMYQQYAKQLKSPTPVQSTEGSKQ